MILYPPEEGRDILRFARDYTMDSPPGMVLLANFFTVPPEPPMPIFPPEILGKKVVAFLGVFPGDAVIAREDYVHAKPAPDADRSPSDR